MLKDRIRMTISGFQILQDADSDRIPSYGLYTLSQDPEVIPDQLLPAKYWDPVNAPEQTITANATMVYVKEEVNGNVVEEARFFWTKSERKPHLIIEVDEAKKYGKNAYMITIGWPDTPGEKINHKYVFLKSRRTGDVFYFLNRFIAPLGDSDEAEDKYIYTIPEEDSPEEYVIDVLPELLMKYEIVRG